MPKVNKKGTIRTRRRTRKEIQEGEKKNPKALENLRHIASKGGKARWENC